MIVNHLKQSEKMTQQNHTEQSLFPIGELSTRTQVNTVTLRAWERRYGLLKPQRTAKGHRLYNEADVECIEKILSLVARGVPIGKVKPLLSDDEFASLDIDDSEKWQQMVSDLLLAVQSFSVTKLEHLLQQSFANYPVPICRQRLIQPMFAELALCNDHGALLAFAESELMRYALLRLSTKRAKKNTAQSVLLVSGKNTPVWPLATVALELADVKFNVQLFTSELTVAAINSIAKDYSRGYIVFYQDGLWKAKEQAVAATALAANADLLMCGTAPMLASLDEHQVFADVSNAVTQLFEHKHNHTISEPAQL